MIRARQEGLNIAASNKSGRSDDRDTRPDGLTRDCMETEGHDQEANEMCWRRTGHGGEEAKTADTSVIAQNGTEILSACKSKRSKTSLFNTQRTHEYFTITSYFWVFIYLIGNFYLFFTSQPMENHLRLLWESQGQDESRRGKHRSCSSISWQTAFEAGESVKRRMISFVSLQAAHGA